MKKQDTRTNRESKPIRVDKDVLDQISPYKERYGSWNKAIKYLLRGDKILWALPSDIFNTQAQARGASLERAVKEGRDSEDPIQVRPLND